MGYFIAVIIGVLLLVSNLIWSQVTLGHDVHRNKELNTIAVFVNLNSTKNASDVVQCIGVKVLDKDRDIKTVIDHKWLNRCIGK